MQDHPRLFAERPTDDVFAPGAELPMTAAQAHYLGAVMRRQPGDAVLLFNALDGEWHASIAALRKERGRFLLDRQTRAPSPEPGPELLFAPLKRDATDLVVRMATELGVQTLRPVLTERTNVARTNPDRWHAIAIEAAEQCERLSVPDILEPIRLTDLLGGWDPSRALLVALERPDTPSVGIAAWRAAAPGIDRSGLLIGPEGGFSPTERRLLIARKYVVPVGLGSLILRAETACIVGLAALRA